VHICQSVSHLKTGTLKLLKQLDGRGKVMAERKVQYKLGLLQYYCSQQDTVSNPAIQLSKLLPSKGISQTGAQYIELDTCGRERRQAVPSDMDMTTCHPAIRTTFSPILDQAIPTTPYPLDQATPTISYPMLDQMSPMSDKELDQEMAIAVYTKKKIIMRLVAIVVVLISGLAFYLIWRPTSSASSLPVVTQQNASRISSNNGTPTDAAVNSSGSIEIYILGAVRHPGVYTLPADARVYQLLLAAGGPLPNADLVALNLAAKLNDGQEVYVTAIGESPPPGLSTSNSGSSSTVDSSSTTSAQGQQLVNINTATAQEMEQQLHVSSKTAQTIINYREQHGPFTSVSQLTQVVSKSIYNKIKNEVTV
jgi:competence protein ComEA